jgi:fumarate reductase (CoM/CoB) subunit B
MLCGVCTLTINGEPRLACATDVEDGMLIEPLKGFPIIKDLVVDYEKNLRKLREIKPFLAADIEPVKVKVSKEAIDKCLTYSYCIACSACLSACPSAQGYGEKFIGPFFFYFLCRYVFDPRDKVDRLRQAFSEGLYRCLSCYRCEEVCPYEIPVNEVAIDELRSRCYERGMSVDYVKEFVKMVDTEGFINSSKLFLKVKGLKMLKDLSWMKNVVVKRKFTSPFKRYGALPIPRILKAGGK